MEQAQSPGKVLGAFCCVVLCNGAIAIPFGIYWLNNPDIVSVGSSTSDQYLKCLASSNSMDLPNYTIQTCATGIGITGCLPLNPSAMSDVTTEFITFF
jgi:hypothetical protein